LHSTLQLPNSLGAKKQVHTGDGVERATGPFLHQHPLGSASSGSSRSWSRAGGACQDLSLPSLALCILITCVPSNKPGIKEPKRKDLLHFSFPSTCPEAQDEAQLAETFLTPPWSLSSANASCGRIRRTDTPGQPGVSWGPSSVCDGPSPRLLFSPHMYRPIVCPRVVPGHGPWWTWLEYV
jgi:hypothetical protein